MNLVAKEIEMDKQDKKEIDQLVKRLGAKHEQVIDALYEIQNYADMLEEMSNHEPQSITDDHIEDVGEVADKLQKVTVFLRRLV